MIIAHNYLYALKTWYNKKEYGEHSMDIKQERLWNHIQALGTIGKQEDGSVTRFPFTIEDKQAQGTIASWMQEAGLEVEVDYVGNVIGTLLGKEEGLSPVVCGSHYDSVKCGGKFDGCLGILSGIEALQTMIENRIQPQRTIKVIAFKDEEGNRFGYGMVGSKSISGCLQEEGFASLDENGTSLLRAMELYGLQPQRYQECKIVPHAFIELHIEQAKVLETENKPIGVVQGIAGLSRYTVTIQGESAHAGATPMLYRQDPVVAMSDWILFTTTLAKKYKTMVATVGEIKTYPGACNVICDKVVFSLDLRSLYDEDRENAMQEIKEYHIQLEYQYGVQISIQKEQSLDACLCEESLQKDLQDICEKNAIPYANLVSGAGHDCMNFKEVCPTAMLFVRSKNGYSHRKEEFSSPIDCAIGTQVLYEMLLRMAE